MVYLDAKYYYQKGPESRSLDSWRLWNKFV